MKFLDSYHDQIFAVSRMVFGFMFAMHGLKNAFGFFGGPPADLPMAAGLLIGGIEIVGGVMVAIGFKTRLAAFTCSGQMAVAYFAVHQKTGILPIQTHGEVAVLYCWAFLMIASVRDWIWAIDSGADAGQAMDGSKQ
jgi:putative oxidoreductase